MIKNVRVLLADDHAILRYGLCAFLNGVDDIEVVGEAENGEECVNLYHKTSPDVCMVDIEMPRKNGIEVIRTIREDDTQTKCIVLSMHADDKTIRSAFQAGSNGYIVKDVPKEAIADAIRKVQKGEQIILNEQQVASSLDEKTIEEADLTNRELEILQLVVDGYSSPQIADQLFISSRTVDTHRNNLMKKLGLKNTASLVRHALQHHLVQAGGTQN